MIFQINNRLKKKISYEQQKGMHMLIYSMHSQQCGELTAKINKYKTFFPPNMTLACADNKQIRDNIIASGRYDIGLLPCILSEDDNGSIKKYEGMKAFEWVNAIIHSNIKKEQPQQQQQNHPNSKTSISSVIESVPSGNEIPKDPNYRKPVHKDLNPSATAQAVKNGLPNPVIHPPKINRSVQSGGMTTVTSNDTKQPPQDVTQTSSPPPDVTKGMGIVPHVKQPTSNTDSVKQHHINTSQTQQKNLSTQSGKVDYDSVLRKAKQERSTR